MVNGLCVWCLEHSACCRKCCACRGPWWCIIITIFIIIFIIVFIIIFFIFLSLIINSLGSWTQAHTNWGQLTKWDS